MGVRFIFTRRTLSRFVPISTWLPECTWKTSRTDVIAGIALAGLLVPEGMAYTGIAGVPPQMGLYAALIGMFVYAIFGTSQGEEGKMNLRESNSEKPAVFCASMAAFTFSILAVAQEEQQRKADWRPEVPTTQSQPNDASSMQVPPDSQVVMSPIPVKSSGRRGSFVVAPLPISSSALGTGIVPTLGCIFPPSKYDKMFPPSVIGAADRGKNCEQNPES